MLDVRVVVILPRCIIFSLCQLDYIVGIRGVLLLIFGSIVTMADSFDVAIRRCHSIEIREKIFVL